MANILRKRKLYIGVLSLIFIIILVVLIIHHFKSFTNIIEFPRDAKKTFTATHKQTKFSQIKKGLGFTQSFWIYITVIMFHLSLLGYHTYYSLL